MTYQQTPPPATGPTPLSAPLYGATFRQAIERFFMKYADFTGRASRSEYWWWALAYFIVVAVLDLLAVALGSVGSNGGGQGPLAVVISVLLVVWSLGTLIPYLALTWRRLHDANYAGPFFFLGLIPFVGGIIVLIFTLLPSNPAGARFDRRA